MYALDNEGRKEGGSKRKEGREMAEGSDGRRRKMMFANDVYV